MVVLTETASKATLTLNVAGDMAFRSLAPLVNITGFQFQYRDGMFDWRLLHGIDIDAVVSSAACCYFHLAQTGVMHARQL